MTKTDKTFVIIALILGIMDVLNVRGPLARISIAGVAVILLAIVELHQGSVLSY